MRRNALKPVRDFRGKPMLPLTPLETEAIALFKQLSRALGQRPSFAEIYGLLFVSPRPLPQDDFIGRLNLSKGSASMGLKFLQDVGAVRTVYVPGDRRVHYEAVAELRNLVSRFLQQQVFTYFDDSGERLDRLADEAKKLNGEQRDFAIARVKMLKSWRGRAKFVLPVLAKLLGGRNGR
jgi:DNA-binding transcriptional regulator GbsR (MarR family)